jgi:hypothetical protein
MMRSALSPNTGVVARLDRAIQYPLTPAIESRSRGVLGPRLRGDDKSGNYFSPTLNGGSLPGGVVSSAIASIIATIT